MTGTIRVACATDTGELIDGHFGSCRAFLVYQVSPQAVEFVNALSTAAADEEEDRNKARAALIDGCQIACFLSIGGPAAAKVVRVGAHPLKVAPNTRVDDMLAKLQLAIKSPPPWLAKVMGVEPASLAPFRELVELDEFAEEE